MMVTLMDVIMYSRSCTALYQYFNLVWFSFKFAFEIEEIMLRNYLFWFFT